MRFYNFICFFVWRYIRLFVLLFLSVYVSYEVNAQEFSASVPQNGKYILKIYPKIYLTSDYFSDAGKQLNMETVTGLLYWETPIQVQYGLSGSLAIGTILPIGWTYQEILPELRKHPIHKLSVREIWLTVQHKYLTIPISNGSLIAASSLRVKIPIDDKEDWEDGLGIGDGQIDIYPVYYFDYYNASNYLYFESEFGYKYRLKNSGIKPSDELNFKIRVGYELFPEPLMRFYIFADLTRFRGGDFGPQATKFFEQDGSLHTFGYGVAARPFPLFHIDIATAGDWSGRNQFRGIRWIVGFTYLF